MIILNTIIGIVIAGCIVAEIKAMTNARKVKKEINVYQAMVLNTNCSDADLQRKAAEIRQML